ncbi:uroporphyrinogen-III C-methyltransferase [Marinobacter sp.]|uniref:uroporphyrinogen-III C-methyltransferase n=1 Tax=Marinobacter sp. TaxID=50741 RepID=UPI00384B5574
MPVTDSDKQLPARTDQTSHAHPRTWPLWLVVILALILTLALAFWSWMQWQKQQSLQQSLSEVSAATDRLDRDYSQTDNQQSERLQALENRLSEMREKIATQQRQIDHNARELLEKGSRTRTDWLLAEAEYLLRLANQRLLIEKDFEGSLTLLKTADEVLAETDDIGVYPVRQQLAREIMALKSISGVDRTGLYLQLEAAIETVQKLTDAALSGQGKAPEPEAIAPLDESESGESKWQRAWQQIKETLSSMVAVRRLDEPVQPPMSAEQSAYARLNLQLMLEEAELALLERNQVLYDRALTKATDFLSRWYDTSENRVQALQSTLAELKDRTIDPELPDISKSLELLKGRIAGRMETTENGSGSDDSSDSGDGES